MDNTGQARGQTAAPCGYGAPAPTGFRRTLSSRGAGLGPASEGADGVQAGHGPCACGMRCSGARSFGCHDRARERCAGGCSGQPRGRAGTLDAGTRGRPASRRRDIRRLTELSSGCGALPRVEVGGRCQPGWDDTTGSPRHEGRPLGTDPLVSLARRRLSRLLARCRSRRPLPRLVQLPEPRSTSGGPAASVSLHHGCHLRALRCRLSEGSRLPYYPPRHHAPEGPGFCGQVVNPAPRLLFVRLLGLLYPLGLFRLGAYLPSRPSVPRRPRKGLLPEPPRCPLHGPYAAVSRTPLPLP